MENIELSLLANFDDLRRCDDILTDGTAEIGKMHLKNVEHYNKFILLINNFCSYIIVCRV